MNTEPTPRPSKPQWLQKLEEESWQAELIISGLAIYGALQAPELIEWLMDWCLASLAERLFPLLYLFFTYLGMGAYVLIFIFISHFVLRTIWVGLVGLNSVFPNGVNEESISYSRHFIRQFKADHPDQNIWIKQLDDLCSTMFGLGAQLVMIFLAINFNIVVLGLIWYLIDRTLGVSIGRIFGWSVAGIFVLYTLAFLISNSKKLRETTVVRRWQYPIYSRFNRIALHAFARPLAYLGMVFQTNLSIRQYVGIVFLILFLVITFFAFRFIDYRFIAFIRPNYLYEYYDQSDRLTPEHYAGLRNDDRRLLSLELENDVVSGDFLRVFVPVLSSESPMMEELCGEMEADADREQRQAFYTDCYRRLHRFYVNDSLYGNPDLVKYDHPNQGEEGILVYLPTADFKPGKNLLRVEKVGPAPDTIFRQMQAVFWLDRSR